MADFGPTITSTQNRWVKFARSLKRRKVRSEERAFLVEGVRLFADALDAGATPSLLFISVDSEQPALRELAGTAHRRGARVVPVTETVLSTLADTQTPQGIVGVFPFPDLEPQIDTGTPPLFVIADGIRDPGNLGTLIRAALGAGAHALYVGPGTTDPFAPKVVRAGMGAHFRLPIHRWEWSAPDPRVARCDLRAAATAHASTDYDAVDWTTAACVIIGSEATGLSPAAREFASATIRIPLAGGLESLNAAMAGTVILFEAARQRRAWDLRTSRGEDSVHTRLNA